MLHQDLQRGDVPLWGYFCQISDSTTSYGSYSGAVPNEKITWGKLGVDTPKYIIESDASIVAPLIFAYLLKWYWMWTNAIGGIRVQVPEQDVDRAKEILGATAMVEAAKDCPRCGTAMRQSAGLGLYPKIALALLLSLPMRSKIKWKCPQCGTIAD
jgi:predicted RNA-binding Zn-ribbon protein involved in translation (DUF1610 family)